MNNTNGGQTPMGSAGFNLPIEPVAKLLLGEPNAALSKKKNELRYGSHGSLVVDIEKDCWHSHEEEKGGGVLDLIGYKAGISDRAGQLKWMEDNGLKERQDDSSPASPNVLPIKPQKVVARYGYTDENGVLLFEVVRFEPKDFRQCRPDGKGGTIWNLKGVQQVPFHLPQLLTADNARPVFIVEGEKDVLRLEAFGLVATCNAGGAGKWPDPLSEYLAGRVVVILPDNDDAGRKHAATVSNKLKGIAASIRVLALPGLPVKGDVSDWLDAGGTADQLLQLVEATEPAEPVDLPAFAAEMPEDAKESFFNRQIQPQPLPCGLPSAMPFDDDLLLESLRGYVRDAADRTQCPPDFVAVALVVGISAVVGRKFTIHPKQRDDWAVVPNQWGVIIGRPSAMKSPALNQALRPLAALEAKERKKHSEAIGEHKASVEMLDIERKAAKAKAKDLVEKGDKDAARNALSAFSNDLPAPIARRYIVNDASVEKLGELLNENPNGLMLVRDELGGWLATMQAEDGAVGRAFYLECFDGSGSFTYDRIGRGTIYIESCCLSLIGGIQPSRIAPLVRGAITGEIDDGLVQRLQLAVWPDDEREWQLVDRWPNRAAKERVGEVFGELDQLPDDSGKALHFADDAQALFNEWYTEHMQAIRSDEIHPAMQSHFMKMPQTIAGLALLFELIEGGRDSVGLVATARALDWADYLKSHAGRLYGAAINAPLMGAQLILERKDKLPEPFTPREIIRKGWAGLNSLDAVNESLATLAEHHAVVGYEVVNDKGGRPSKRYVWRRAL